MKIIITLFAIAAAGTGIAGAYYWYKASKVVVLPSWVEAGNIEPADPHVSSTSWIVALMQSFQTASDLNATAARWTAVSVVLAVATTLLGTWSSCG